MYKQEIRKLVINRKRKNNKIMIIKRIRRNMNSKIKLYKEQFAIFALQYTLVTLLCMGEIRYRITSNKFWINICDNVTFLE